METFGKHYARQVVRNAQTLAKVLADANFPVACPQLGYTRSHQVLLNYGGNKEGRVIARKLEAANIIVDSGVRIGVCEVTRMGMKEKEMQSIAAFITRVVAHNEASSQVKKDVITLVDEFREVGYCFR
jgi:glycine hydroxymethyltransferase